MKTYDPPMAIEQLFFEVDPEKLDCWLEIDHEVWTAGLAEWPGFAGKEVWINQDRPGEITVIVYWTSYEKWKSIDPEWVARTDAAFRQALAEVGCRQELKGLGKERFCKVCECVP